MEIPSGSWLPRGLDLPIPDRKSKNKNGKYNDAHSRLPHPLLSLTWTLLDAEGAVGVFGSGVVFQLEGDRVVDKRLWALGHTCPAVIEVSTGLQKTPKKQLHIH